MHSARPLSPQNQYRQRAPSPSPAVHGLGLSFANQRAEQCRPETRRGGQQKEKPALRLEIKHNMPAQVIDVPPAVPPKSPRTHQRALSANSNRLDRSAPCSAEPSSGTRSLPEGRIQKGPESAPLRIASGSFFGSSDKWFPLSADSRVRELMSKPLQAQPSATKKLEPDYTPTKERVKRKVSPTRSNASPSRCRADPRAARTPTEQSLVPSALRVRPSAKPPIPDPVKVSCKVRVVIRSLTL